ncbi:toxic anion resistance protein [Ruoffia tabacinasalis]|uniref:Toxic anion resistance protein n=1 Tax=Ruoffia tabacinasalis TaxID=87458 RepID=A0A5R9EPD7_9LACT|nr:toxic anion resistance protein [Ruoffia tabacinasalis]MBG9978464.1 toxic anion resistance protein [Ruoffia tabacinasalis]TLQ49350.1 toxic anion resistance protein [Ruoffia tabacinasalis]
MTEEKDLFDELLEQEHGSINEPVQPKQQESSEFDELLANPFDETIEQTLEKDLADQEMIAKRQVSNEKLIERLPEHRQKQAQDLAKQIDEANMGAIIAYGSNAQKKLSEFSRSILQQVQLKDTGEVGDVLTELMTKLQESDPRQLTAEPNIFQRVFKRVKSSITETQMRYQQIGSQIDRVAIRLEREKTELLNDNQMLEQFYNKNKDYFDALNVYIAAGEVKMEQLQNEVIPAAIEKARQSQDQMEVQKVNDLNQFLDRLDKRTHDLRLTRQMTIQQAPQIRMIQNTNQVLAEKIQVSVHTAIPLWENQITIALALLRQQNAATSQRQVSETTNSLLLKNSEMLKQSTVDIAREAERGVIDIDTLRKTQANLVGALEETLEIQKTGRQQRRLAEQELTVMENELHDKLLAISDEQKRQRQDGTTEY